MYVVRLTQIHLIFLFLSHQRKSYFKIRKKKAWPVVGFEPRTFHPKGKKKDRVLGVIRYWKALEGETLLFAIPVYLFWSSF